MKWKKGPNQTYVIDDSTPPTKAELLVQLELAKQAYIDQHYPGPTREWMIAYYLNPEATEAGKALIMNAWNWVNSQVLPYYFTTQGEINADQTPTLNFAQFDESDPQVTVQAIMEVQ